MEHWNEVDWTGVIRVYPINEEHEDNWDDYDERRNDHGRAYDG